MTWLTAVLLLVPMQDDAKQELEQLKKRMAELEKKVGAQEPQDRPVDLPKMAQESKRDAGEVYSKPFLARFGRNVYLGGYMDLEYFNFEDSNSDTFDQHRLVPFIYADVSDHIKVAMEIEIEHGNGTELGVEFAHVDYWFAEWINFRAGIILDPLGRFNLVHDAPFQDLTQRPLVDEFVIPVVLREPGVGFFGSADSGTWEFEYEAYVVNGFKGLSKTGTTVINKNTGLRNARPHSNALGTAAYRDFNDNKAVVGRFSVSPFLGLEAGISAHTGKYDERGDNTLTIWAVDWTVNLGGIMRQVGATADFWSTIEFVGEYAAADLGTDALADAAVAGTPPAPSPVPGELSGYYLEARYHFMPEFIRKIVPGGSDESTFTLTYRYDSIDLDGAERTAHMVGFNFRPREDTVFKLEYQWREEHGDATDIDDDRFVASVATYF